MPAAEQRETLVGAVAAVVLAIGLLLVALTNRAAQRTDNGLFHLTADFERVTRAARCAGALLAVKLFYLSANFAWGGMSQGSWAKQLVECLLAASWLAAILITAGICGAAKGAQAVGTIDGRAGAFVTLTL